MMKGNRGVALATLAIAVLVMLTITGTIVYTSTDTMKLRKLDDMYSDIRLLNQRITNYYIENNELPILEDIIKYGEIESIVTVEQNEERVKKNPNDGDEYYIIDLEKLGGITLKNGKDYKDENIIENGKTDVYVINEASHTIYYLKGVAIDGIERYSLEESYEKIALPTVSTTQ